MQEQLQGQQDRILIKMDCKIHSAGNIRRAGYAKKK